MRSWLKSSKIDLKLITRGYLGSYSKSHSRPCLIGTLAYKKILEVSVLFRTQYSPVHFVTVESPDELPDMGTPEKLYPRDVH